MNWTDPAKKPARIGTLCQMHIPCSMCGLVGASCPFDGRRRHQPATDRHVRAITAAVWQ